MIYHLIEVYVRPHLFILCGEMLSALIRKPLMDDTLHDIRIAYRACCVSHILFAYDNIIFARATIRNENLDFTFFTDV